MGSIADIDGKIVGLSVGESEPRMRHSTIRLTFDRYGHLFPSLDDRLRDGLDETFANSLVSDPCHEARPLTPNARRGPRRDL